MERHPGIINGGVVRKDGSTTPANAGDVLAIVVEQFALAKMPLLPRFRAIAGKQVKECLEGGIDAETMVLATAIAFKRGEPHRLVWIAQDLVLARGGVRMTRLQYEKALQDEMEIGGLR